MSDLTDKKSGEPSPYQMTLSLNVLNHLGINLYSNVPAVLAGSRSKRLGCGCSNRDCPDRCT